MKANSIASIFTLSLLFLLLTTSLFADVIQRDNAILFAGPGAYYQQLAKFPQGTACAVIRTDGEWVLVSIKQQQGYLAKKVLNVPALDTGFNRFVSFYYNKSKSIQANAQFYAELIGSDLSTLQYMADNSLTEENVINYRKLSKDKYFVKPNKANNVAITNSYDSIRDIDVSIGQAMAAKLAVTGIWADTTWNNYLNQLGNYIVSQSEEYDKVFHFSILDSNDINVVTFPGGYVYITKGLLKSIQNEAELAAVLAHEVAFVTCFHKIVLSDKTANAQSPTQTKIKRTPNASPSSIWSNADMKRQIIGLYDLLLANKYTNNNAEIDKMGLLYTSRAGYEPGAYLALMTRLYDKQLRYGNYDGGVLELQIKTLNYLKTKMWSNPTATYNKERWDNLYPLLN